jgi:hypothetical protein
LFRVSAALGIHLIVYCAIGACLAFGLYVLLQPSRTPNSDLAVYKPPPAAVVTYGERSPATTGAEPIAPVEQPIAPIPLGDPEPVTTGRSTPEPELKPTITGPPPPVPPSCPSTMMMPSLPTATVMYRSSRCGDRCVRLCSEVPARQACSRQPRARRASVSATATEAGRGDAQPAGHAAEAPRCARAAPARSTAAARGG